MPHWCIGSISRRQRDETGSIPVCGSIFARRPTARTPDSGSGYQGSNPCGQAKLQSEGKVLGRFIPVHELGALPRTATSQLAELAQQQSTGLVNRRAGSVTLIRLHCGWEVSISTGPITQSEVGAAPASRDHLLQIPAAANDGRSGASYASGRSHPWFDSRCRHHTCPSSNG